MKAKLKKIDPHYFLIVDDKTFGSTMEPHLSASIRHALSLKNCQAIERGYDLDELADEYYMEFENKIENPALFYRYFKLIFPKALELLSDKKFSEEDVRGAYIQGTNDGAQFESMRDYDSEDDNEPWEFAEEAEKELIQSLQQTEWDVEICCHIKEDNGWLDADTFNSPMLTSTSEPKLDAENCLILKRL